MKTKFFILAFFYLLGLWYLVLPSAPYPELNEAIRSDEPGDTWQHPDQKGFYTNQDRRQVLTDIQNQFSLKVGTFTLPSYRLNYRPEEAYDFVRELLQSYYLEEIIYPLRESIFVNGWEPKKSPQYINLPPKAIPDISFRGIPYNSKVTLKPTSSPVWARIIIWTIAFPASYLVYLSLKKSLYEKV